MEKFMNSIPHGKQHCQKENDDGNQNNDNFALICTQSNEKAHNRRKPAQYSKPKQ